MDEDKSEALVGHVDHLLITCTLQLRVTYSKHMSQHVDSSTTTSTLQHDVLSLYKCLLATLLSVSSTNHLFHLRQSSCEF